MEPNLEKMQAQLKRWALKIERLAAKTHAPGVRAGYDAVMHVDELKALHAVARSKLDEFMAVEERRRARMMIEVEGAWEDLDAAFKKRAP